MKEGGNADGQKNRQADKSGSSTYTTCLRDWNSHSSNQNDCREYPIATGEGTPPVKIYHISIAESMKKRKLIREVVKAVAMILWLIVVVVGLILLLF